MLTETFCFGLASASTAVAASTITVSAEADVANVRCHQTLEYKLASIKFIQL